MRHSMLQFVETDQAPPPKREVADRAQDFAEIYAGFEDAAAATQSARCSQCGVPYCQTHCPLHNHIPDWLMLAANGRLEEAYAVSSSTNPMPEICGRICPQDRLCEGACVIEQAGHGTVTIGAVEKYITDTAWEKGWVQPIKTPRERPERVAIIGAGPAGLAAAEALRRDGIQVEIYDRYDRAGGLLIYGIPGFKLEKPVVHRRIQRLEAAGVLLHLNKDIGQDITFESLRAEYDALLIATGVYKARALDLEGVTLDGVVPALDYLTASNRADLGDSVPALASGELDAQGKQVVVIGGGDTAMDCVRTAVRQGAKSVTCLYRRDRENMPGSQREVINAEEEGVQFTWLTAPAALVGAQGQVQAVRATQMSLTMPDASGRRSVSPVAGSEHEIPADFVIQALGFEPEDLPTLFNCPELAVSDWGTIKVSWRTMMTELDGVFAAGDIVRGASLVVWGVRDGLEAAKAMTEWLDKRSLAQAAE